MVASDQPLRSIPLVCEGVPGFYTGPGFLKREGVETSIDRGVAINLNVSRVNPPDWSIFHKVVKVILFIDSAKSWSA